MKEFKTLITSQGLYGAVLATLTFVMIGFFITKKGLFNKETNGKISKFLLNWALPFLCIVAFMKNADATNAKEVGVVLGLSTAFYVLIAVYNWAIIKFVPNMVSAKIKHQADKMWEQTDKTENQEKFREAHVASYRQKLMTSQMMIAYGSLQFFAVPLVSALTGTNVFNGFSTALLQVWNLPYMIGAFTYVQMAYSGQKMSKDQIKPIMKALFHPMMICLYVSAILWALQFAPVLNTQFVINPKAPFAEVFDASKHAGKAHGQFWGGLLGQLPVIAAILIPGVKIISPLAWLVIGGSLATSDLKAAAKDGSVWVTTMRKLITLPLVMFALGFLFVPTKVLSHEAMTLIVLLAACPPAAVTIIFSVAYKHEHSGYTAQVNSLSTLLCLITMPIWVVIAHVSYVAVV
ncbi:AEC family transporter [Mycoplasma sp. Mirounga ES2805-ORL]|uniref:AEC family transporter n=1 Tax=Mycoplasma sp. Mirounga ES2805-ORL TaxID=754514 RepID=UPI00197B52DA|nr:AEC family transporter [Mycoplasma sp. Mirounga ES2805-ORL]QSF13971.1 malate transporter [Mycoplasma sp. Mirounga ES2805-ORL]